MSRTLEWDLKRVVRLVLVGGVVLFALLILPDVLHTCWTFTPLWIRPWSVELFAVSLVTVYVVTMLLARLASASRWRKLTQMRAGLARVDSWAEVAWNRGLSLALGAVCIGFLAGWLPQYLTWPWSRDEDTFSVLAMSWDRGILPYRDIRAYNFPGETYLFWLLGKVFGWGRTAPFYAVDGACVVILGAAIFAWSRRRLHGILPGLVAYLTFLWFYLSQPFELTGERDWHAAFLMCLGLLLLQTWPGKWSRIGSALLTAMALMVRPQSVLFVPAIIVAMNERGTFPDKGWSARARRVGEWAGWTSGFLALLLAPVVIAGIGDDWLRGLRVASYGGPYSRATPSASIALFAKQFWEWRTDLPLAATLVLALNRDERLRGLSRGWLCAWAGALVYRPISPVPHYYLIHPVVLVGSIGWSFVAYGLTRVRVLPRPVHVIAFALLAYEAAPQLPLKWNLTRSVEAVRSLALGEDSELVPMGAIQCFYGSTVPKSPWWNYCELLKYLRESTRPETYVANVLNRYPMESLNGPSGRLSPFLAESGICWLQWVKIDLDGEFARQLEATVDSVVVWEPDQKHVDPTMKVSAVIEVVRRCYEPEAKFQNIEVWRRRKEPGRAEK